MSAPKRKLRDNTSLEHDHDYCPIVKAHTIKWGEFGDHLGRR